MDDNALKSQQLCMNCIRDMRLLVKDTGMLWPAPAPKVDGCLCCGDDESYGPIEAGRIYRTVTDEKPNGYVFIENIVGYME